MGSGMALGFISFLIFLNSLWAPEPGQRIAFWPGGRGATKIGLVVLTLFLYGILLEYLGFLLCTFIALLFLLRVIETQKWSSSISFAVITTVVSYAVFELSLKSQFPKGILPWP